MQTRITLRHWPVAGFLAVLALAGCTPPPGAGTPTTRLADAALVAGYPQMALSVADHILARDPRNVPALVARGDALVNSGRTEDAADSYRKALAVKPDDPAANLGLGRVMLRRDPHAAERMFRKALASRPEDPVLLSNLGVALDLQERHVEAQTAYRQSLRAAPDVAATKANLGLSLALSGQRAEAQRLLAPLAADPNASQVVRDNLAVAQMQAVAPAAAPPPSPAPPPAPSAPAPRAPAPSAPTPSAPAPMTPVSAAPAPVAPVPATPTPVAPAPAPAAAAPTPLAATAPVAAPAPVEGPSAGAYVQLAAADNQESAQAGWEREQRQAGQLLVGRSPQIAEATVAGRRFWRVRVPTSTVGEAKRLCAALQARGMQCWTDGAGL